MTLIDNLLFLMKGFADVYKTPNSVHSGANN